MRRTYRLTAERAKQQVLLQRSFVKYFTLFDNLSAIVYALFVFRIASGHFTRISFGTVYVLKLALSLSLFFAINAAAKRVCLLGSELFFASLFLSANLGKPELLCHILCKFLNI